MSGIRTKIPIAVAGLFLFEFLASAREQSVGARDVPTAVHEAVKKRYPDARAVSYAREREGGKITYEVSIRVRGHEIDVGVSRSGQIVSEEERITKGELPAAVNAAFAASPRGRAQVEKVERVIEKKNGDAPRFELVVREGRQRFELVFDAGGRLIREERLRATD